MARLGLADGDLVDVTSRRGADRAAGAGAARRRRRRRCSSRCTGARSSLSGRRRGAGEARRLAGVNALTQPAFCPQSKQPELKHAAVKVAQAELPWRLLALAWLPRRPRARRARGAAAADGASSRSRAACRSAASAAACCSAPPPPTPPRAGAARRDRGAARPRRRRAAARACTTPTRGAASAARCACRARGDDDAARRLPARRRHRRRGVDPAAAAGASCRPRPTAARCSAPARDAAGADGGARPPGLQLLRRQRARDRRLRSHGAGGAAGRGALLRLQAELKCGTNCGSCLPELRRLVAAAPAARAAAEPPSASDP